jgi:hypothetical protein
MRQGAGASEEGSRLPDMKGFDQGGNSSPDRGRRRNLGWQMSHISCTPSSPMRPGIPPRSVALAIWLRDEVEVLSIALPEHHRLGTWPRQRVVYFAFFRLPDGAAVILIDCAFLPTRRVTHLRAASSSGSSQNSRGRPDHG